MNQASDNVIPIQRRPSNHISRVRRKREILQNWLKDGIPAEKAAEMPRSLAQARAWEDPSLGIFAIGSPNSFTTKHPDVGADVAAISALIVKLMEKTKKISSRSKRRKLDQQGISAQEVQRALSAMAAQWYMAREDLSRERSRAEKAEKHLEIARAESRSKDEEIAELRRRLTVGLTVVR